MSTNSTSTAIGWAPEPEGRGTIGLLYSCFATIFICTWSVIHPNVPPEHHSQWRNFWTRTKYFVYCLFAPEILAVFALIELRSAITLKAKSPGWSLQKCFFLRMGGFVIQYGPDYTPSRCRFDILEYVEYLEEKRLPWPEVDKEEIDDRSNADWFVKSLALVQITWFSTQLVGRAMQGLAITTLELFTVAIVFCAAIMYTALWEKPFEVNRPIVVHFDGEVPVPRYRFEAVSFDIDESSSYLEAKHPWFSLLTLLVCIGFGTLHIVAWNFHFPTHAEVLLWRISAIGCISLPTVSFFLSDFIDAARRRGGETWHADWVLVFLFAVYGIFRLYMLVEMFVSLRAVDASVYKTPQWSQYFPAFQ